MDISDEGGMHEQTDFVDEASGHQGTNQVAAAIYAQSLHSVLAPQFSQCGGKIDSLAACDDFFHTVCRAEGIAPQGNHARPMTNVAERIPSTYPIPAVHNGKYGAALLRSWQVGIRQLVLLSQDRVGSHERGILLPLGRQ